MTAVGTTTGSSISGSLVLIRQRFEECEYDVSDYSDEQIVDALATAAHDLHAQWLSLAHVSWAHSRLRCAARTRRLY